ncbi:hypothetical protein EDD37DRAFT_440365 [Exophiala viscosa]|uniref:uncharacterized protein n=1 Tax=Exophiala viscosa TaxID=2486360 RepID=UPI002198C9E9|nr:hypothetical protein EDD37DRAFT_440365 [Exophiala viscosa]
MDLGLHSGSLDMISWISTNYPTTISSRSSTISRRNCHHGTSNTPLTSPRTSPHTSLPASRSTDLSRLLTSGLKRSSSVLSLSLFRSKTRAGKANGGSIKDAKTTSSSFQTQRRPSSPNSPRPIPKLRPPIPVRPSERLYNRSVLELGSYSPKLDSQEEIAESPPCYRNVNRAPQVKVQSVQRLGDLDPDKRGNAFVRIQPDGWLKVIPKQWVEDEFSVDEACTEDSRSVYSQDNGNNYSKVQDDFLDDRHHSTSLLWKNGVPPASAPGSRFQLHESETKLVAECPIVPARSKRRKFGSGILSDGERDQLVPAPLRLGNQKEKSTAKHRTEHAFQPANETLNKATSKRSSWTSILCDNRSETDCSNQTHGGFDITRREKHEALLLPCDWHGPAYEELADGPYPKQDNLIADIDEILDLYLTSDHKPHRTKGKISIANQPRQQRAITSKSTLSILRDLVPDKHGPILPVQPAMTANDHVDLCHGRGNRTGPYLDQHRAPHPNGDYVSAHPGSRYCALCPKPRPKPQATKHKDRPKGVPWLLRGRKHLNTYAHVHQLQQEEHKNPANVLKVGSPPATATATFLNGNGDSWI